MFTVAAFTRFFQLLWYFLRRLVKPQKSSTVEFEPALPIHTAHRPRMASPDISVSALSSVVHLQKSPVLNGNGSHKSPTSDISFVREANLRLLAQRELRRKHDVRHAVFRGSATLSHDWCSHVSGVPFHTTRSKDAPCCAFPSCESSASPPELSNKSPKSGTVPSLTSTSTAGSTPSPITPANMTSESWQEINLLTPDRDQLPNSVDDCIVISPVEFDLGLSFATIPKATTTPVICDVSTLSVVTNAHSFDYATTSFDLNFTSTPPSKWQRVSVSVGDSAICLPVETMVSPPIEAPSAFEDEAYDDNSPYPDVFDVTAYSRPDSIASSDPLVILESETESKSAATKVQSSVGLGVTLPQPADGDTTILSSTAGTAPLAINKTAASSIIKPLPPAKDQYRAAAYSRPAPTQELVELTSQDHSKLTMQDRPTSTVQDSAQTTEAIEVARPDTPPSPTKCDGVLRFPIIAKDSRSALVDLSSLTASRRVKKRDGMTQFASPHFSTSGMTSLKSNSPPWPSELIIPESPTKRVMPARPFSLMRAMPQSSTKVRRTVIPRKVIHAWKKLSLPPPRFLKDPRPPVPALAKELADAAVSHGTHSLSSASPAQLARQLTNPSMPTTPLSSLISLTGPTSSMTWTSILEMMPRDVTVKTSPLPRRVTINDSEPVAHGESIVSNGFDDSDDWYFTADPSNVSDRCSSYLTSDKFALSITAIVQQLQDAYKDVSVGRPRTSRSSWEADKMCRCDDKRSWSSSVIATRSISWRRAPASLFSGTDDTFQYVDSPSKYSQDEGVSRYHDKNSYSDGLSRCNDGSPRGAYRTTMPARRNRVASGNEKPVHRKSVSWTGRANAMWLQRRPRRSNSESWTEEEFMRVFAP